MANQTYSIAANRRANALFNWNTMDIAIVAWSGTLDFVTTDATIQAIITRGLATKRGVSLSATGKAVLSSGGCRSDPIVIPSLTVGAPITFLTMIERNVVENNSVPLYYIDTAWELPFAPNGLDIPITPDWNQNKVWFQA